MTATLRPFTNMLKGLMSTKVINQGVKTSYMMKTIKANTAVLPEISYYPSIMAERKSMILCCVTFTFHFCMLSSNRLLKSL